MSNKLGFARGHAYLGTNAPQPPNWSFEDRDPTSHDNFNYVLGDLWLNKNTRCVWCLVSLEGDSNSKGILANWILLGCGPFGSVIGLRADDGDDAFPDPNTGLVNVFGGTGINTTADNANTLTVSVSGDVATSYDTDMGTAIPANNVLNVFGGNGINTSAPGNVDIVQIDVTDDVAQVFPTDFTSPAIPSGNELEIFGGAAIDAEQVALVFRQNIHTAAQSGAGNTVFVKLNDSISLPNSTADGRAGVVYLGGVASTDSFLHNYGTNNTFAGHSSGNFTLTTASAVSNTGMGLQALFRLTTGSDNVAMGWANLALATTGSFNTCSGAGGMAFLTTGTGNVGVGSQVFSDGGTATGLTTGSNNIALGRDAAADYTSSESSNIILGAFNFGVVGDNNTLRIGVDTGTGNGELNRAFIAGIRGITTGVADAIPVLIDSAGQLGTVSSSAKHKMRIKDMDKTSEAIMRLRPVTFVYKEDNSMTDQFGLIAEEVETVLPQLCIYDSKGEPSTVRYHDLPVLLLNELQKLVNRVEQLEQKLKDCDGTEK